MFLRSVSVLFLSSLVLAAAADPSLPDVFARMDRAAAEFKGFTANVRYLTHTDVINQDDIETGTIKVKRGKGRDDMKMLIELSDPDPKMVAVQGKKGEIYYPRIQTVQEYDLGKYREWMDQFYLVGFGTTSKELQQHYQVRILGTDTKGGQKVAGLELIPKSPEILRHLKKIELWISDTNGLPVEQKLYPTGQYKVITYSKIIVNPDFRDSALKLQLPKGVKREFPQK